jgi:hypothetical protein
MTHHTEGPWTIPAPWSGFSEIRGPNGEFIFGLAAGSDDVKQSNEACEANARLIAAAPTMLAALKECRDAEMKRRAKLKPGAPATTYTEARLERINAAISLACGSSTKDIEG